MSGSFCGKCGDYVFATDKCNCRLYNVIDDEWGESVTIYAQSEQGAAKKHAEKYNEDGGLINESKTILVNGSAYMISAEPSVEYYARKLN